MRLLLVLPVTIFVCFAAQAQTSALIQNCDAQCEADIKGLANYNVNATWDSVRIPAIDALAYGSLKSPYVKVRATAIEILNGPLTYFWSYDGRRAATWRIETVAKDTDDSAVKIEAIGFLEYSETSSDPSLATLGIDSIRKIALSSQDPKVKQKALEILTKGLGGRAEVRDAAAAAIDSVNAGVE